MHHHTELSFVDEFQCVSPLHYLKNIWQKTVLFGACCKRGRHLYTTIAPSFCVPAPYCHLSATLQTMSIIIVKLRYNWAAFRIFIALLRFSFESPSYISSFLSHVKRKGLIWRFHIIWSPLPLIFLKVRMLIFCYLEEQQCLWFLLALDPALYVIENRIAGGWHTLVFRHTCKISPSIIWRLWDALLFGSQLLMRQVRNYMGYYLQ
jgi:hypothetical protein